MSRVAKSPIPVPAGVEVNIAESVTVKGKLGELSFCPPECIAVEMKPSEGGSSTLVIVDKAYEALKARLGDAVNPKSGEPAKAGMVRALVHNMVIGVSQGFECKLEMQGVGFRAKATGKLLELSVGFSHPVHVEMPEGVSVNCPKQTEITVSGADKQLVFQVAANIRRYRPAEVYKGKGIRYLGEFVKLKEVKKK